MTDQHRVLHSVMKIEIARPDGVCLWKMLLPCDKPSLGLALRVIAGGMDPQCDIFGDMIITIKKLQREFTIEPSLQAISESGEGGDV